MREFKLSHTTHALVALALALGFVSVRPGLPAGARSAPPAGPLVGGARVIDGDTIAIGETRIRLEGIDAPETAQRCGRRWLGTWACGVAARLALRPKLSQPAGGRWRRVKSTERLA